MRTSLLATILLLGTALAAAGAWYWYGDSTRAREAIRGSGIIEVTQVDVSFEIPGRIAERYADEGSLLDRGEPIARLDEREYRLQVERAAAARDAADARFRLLRRGSRAQSIDEALAALEAAESELALHTREEERIRRLFGSGVVAKADLDRIETARAARQAARERARAQLDLLREGFRSEEIEEARARLRLAEQELALAELNLARCQVFAPIAGRVLSKSREPGEMAQPGAPVVTIGDLSRPWVNLYVGERDLGRVALGMPAEVTVDSFPGRPFAGKVTFISERAEFTPKNIHTPDERVKLVYRVKVEVESPEQVLKPGMPADVELPLHPRG